MGFLEDFGKFRAGQAQESAPAPAPAPVENKSWVDNLADSLVKAVTQTTPDAGIGDSAYHTPTGVEQPQGKLYQDAAQAFGDWRKGAVQGLAEIGRRQGEASTYGLTDENGMTYVKPGATMEDVVNAEDQANQAKGTFLRETVKPVAMPLALAGGPVGAAAGVVAAPFMMEDAINSYKKGGIGEVTRDFTYGGIADMANQPNIAEQFGENPARMSANAGMAVIPAALMGKGVYKGSMSMRDMANQALDREFAKFGDDNPFKAPDAMDETAYWSNPTQELRSKPTADEYSQWKADQVQRNIDEVYQPLFDQTQPAARRMQGEINANAGDSMMNAAQRMDVGAEMPEKRPYQGGNSVIFGEEPIRQDLILPKETVPEIKPNQQKPFVTAEDLIDATQARMMDGRLREAVNSRNHAVANKIVADMTEKGYETPLSRAVSKQNIEYSKAPNTPIEQMSREDAALKAKQAAFAGDHDSAMQYAQMSGDPAVMKLVEASKAFDSRASSDGGVVPQEPRISGKANGSYDGDTITKRTLMQRAEELFAPIRTGRIGQADANGWINHNTGVIRARNYGDIGTVSHEVGHWVDAALGLRKDAGAFDREFSKAVNDRFGEGTYEPQQVRAEGIAEFMRNYATDQAKARQMFPKYFDAFQSALKSNPDVAARVGEFSDMVKAWEGQSPEARGRGGVSYSYENKKSMIDKGKEAWFTWREKLFDDKAGLSDLTKQVEKLTGEKLATEDDPYKMARLAQGSAVGRAEMLLESKKPELVQKVLNDIYGADTVRSGVTMKSILSKMSEFEKSNKEYLKAGNFKDGAEALDTLLVARRQAEIQSIHPEYKGPISKEDAASIIKNAPPELTAMAKECYRYNDDVLRIANRAGLISDEAYQTISQKYQNYVSMARDFSDEAAVIKGIGGGKGFANVRKAIQTISEEGSTRQVVSPLENMVKNTYAILALAERNRVGQNIAKLADKDRLGSLIEEVSGTAKTKDSTFSVWFDGEKRTYQTTPEIYRAVMSMNEEGSNFFTKLLSVPASSLRAGATLTPDFIFKNMSRDMIGALVFSRYGFRPFIDQFKGLASYVRKDELYHEYQASGALMSTIVGMDRNYTYETMSKLFKTDWKGYANPLTYLRALTEVTEMATRIGEFSRARDKGAGLSDAGLSARDVTLDFGKAGQYGRTLNKFDAFFNAAIQEPARMAQAFKENPKGTSAKIAAFITMPSVMLWCMNHDQDWYKEVPQYQKDLFWMFKAGDTVYRVPKPFGMGILFGSGPERMLDYFADRDPDGMKKWAKSAFDGFMPNLLPTVATPIMGWISNYDNFLGRDIVPKREEKLPNEMQFGPNTSALAKGIGSATGQSPRKIDYVFNSLGGGLARQTLGAADAITGSREWKNPFSAAFTVDPDRSPQSIQTFYEKLTDYEKTMNGHKAVGTKPTAVEAQNDRTMTNANKVMTRLNKQEREIMQSKTLTDEQKETKVKSLNQQQMALARMALKNLK